MHFLLDNLPNMCDNKDNEERLLERDTPVRSYDTASLSEDFEMIDFIDAHNGGIKMFAGDNLKGWAKTATGIAYTLKTCGVADAVYGSGSMDFAADYGFDTNDGAMLLYKRALELI